MNIMKNDDLKNVLRNLKNSHVVIISAFVSGVFDELEELLENKNKVEIYTGVLNCFNSPYNMQKFAKIAAENKNFLFKVDFNSATSTHWKIYIVNGKTLYVGSANFTAKGISLERDTLLKVCKEDICKEYLEETKNEKYVSSKNPDFEEKLAQYISKYKAECKRHSVQYDANSPDDVEITIISISEDFDDDTRRIANQLLDNGVKKGLILENEKKGLKQYSIGYYCCFALHQVILIIDLLDVSYHEIIDIEMNEDEDDEENNGLFFIYTKRIRSNSQKVPLILTEQIKNVLRNKSDKEDWPDSDAIETTKQQILEWTKK